MSGRDADHWGRTPPDRAPRGDRRGFFNEARGWGSIPFQFSPDCMATTPASLGGRCGRDGVERAVPAWAGPRPSAAGSGSRPNPGRGLPRRVPLDGQCRCAEHRLRYRFAAAALARRRPVRHHACQRVQRGRGIHGAGLGRGRTGGFGVGGYGLPSMSDYFPSYLVRSAPGVNNCWPARATRRSSPGPTTRRGRRRRWPTPRPTLPQVVVAPTAATRRSRWAATKRSPGSRRRASGIPLGAQQHPVEQHGRQRLDGAGDGEADRGRPDVRALPIGLDRRRAVPRDLRRRAEPAVAVRAGGAQPRPSGRTPRWSSARRRSGSARTSYAPGGQPNPIPCPIRRDFAQELAAEPGRQGRQPRPTPSSRRCGSTIRTAATATRTAASWRWRSTGRTPAPWTAGRAPPSWTPVPRPIRSA